MTLLAPFATDQSPQAAVTAVATSTTEAASTAEVAIAWTDLDPRVGRLTYFAVVLGAMPDFIHQAENVAELKRMFEGMIKAQCFVTARVLTEAARYMGMLKNWTPDGFGMKKQETPGFNRTGFVHLVAEATAALEAELAH